MTGHGDEDPYADAIAADLLASKGKALVLVGEEMSPEIHSLGHRINQTLGAFGRTADLIEPVDPHPRNTATASPRWLPISVTARWTRC